MKRSVFRRGGTRTTAAAPRVKPDRRQALAIWPYAGVLILAVICALALLAWNAQQGQEQWQRGVQAELAERDARLAVARLQRRLDSASSALAVLASEERLQQAFEHGNQAQLAELQQEYQHGLPEVTRLALLPVGLSVPDMEAQPPIGYAVLEMLRRAEQSAAAPAAEVYRPGQAGAHVNLVQPVQGSAGIVGHVLVTYPVEWLQQALVGMDGGVSLQQAGALVFKTGPTEGVQVRLPVPEADWQLVYVAPLAAAEPARAHALLPLVLFGVLLLIILAVFFLLQREFGKRALTKGTVLPPTTRRQLAKRRQRSKPKATRSVSQAERPLSNAKPAPAAPAEVAVSPGRPIKINPRILRAYDVRGVVGQGLDAEVVYGFGRAIATLAAEAGQQAVVVAKDGRLSSPELHQALIQGLVAGGREVIDIGMAPTPMMHFATFHLNTGAGVMVTGSHNPPEYNGLKIVIGGRTLSGDEISALGQRVEQGDFVSGEGSVRTESVQAAYIDRITQDATLHRPLRIVVDCGNGVAGGVAPQVFRAMGCEVEELFCEVDGYFPNHHPDPTVETNLEAMISLVRLQGADLGLAFDGDGDRLGVVDARGRILWADRQLMFFARDVLSRSPGGHVVFDVKCSSQLAAFVTEHAGLPVMWKSGHSMIRNKMRELSAPLAGDMSGHIFFADRWYGFDDAIYAGARLLELLSMDARSSDQVFDELPEALGTAEIRLGLAEGEAEHIMASLGADFAAAFSGARITSVDGLRVDLADSWALVRASNTEPCLVLRFEGDDQAALDRIQGAFRERLLSIKPDLELPF